MNKAIKAILVILILFLGFGYWYRSKFSMKVAASYEVNTPDELNKVFIATQGSVFKDLLVKKLVEELTSRSTYIKVVDVSDLPNVEVSDWDALVILHSWEMQKPPEPVKAFVDANVTSNKLVVFSTSGTGKDGMKNVDGITGASVLSEIKADLKEIVDRIGPLLKEKQAV